MVKIQQRTITPVSMGEYPATITAVESIDGTYGPELQFDLILHNEARTQLRAWAGASLSPKSKLGRWVQAILGKLPQELDTDKLVGVSCMAVVLVKTRTSDGSTYNRVDELRADKRRDLGGGVIVGAER